jgi:hypothetical protein
MGGLAVGVASERPEVGRHELVRSTGQRMRNGTGSLRPLVPAMLLTRRLPATRSWIPWVWQRALIWAES